MEEDNINEINKKRKTDNKKYLNYYLHSKRLYTNYENNPPFINSQFNNQIKSNKTFNVSVDHNNSSQQQNLNKNINLNVKPIYNNKYNSNNNNIDYNDNNSYGINNNKGNKITHHPFLNKSSKDKPDFTDDELNKAFELELPSKIFISESLKNNYADDINMKKKMKKQRTDKVGLSSNEYNSYKVEIQSNVSYEHAKKLHQLWNIYVNELLELSSNNELSLDTINDMELNGAYVEIHKSRCSTYIGIKGIIVLETQNSFKIITPKNKVLILLKNKSVFIIKIKERLYYLHGIQLMRDPALKSSKKYKMLQSRII
ncbi:conserved Plasmodium protein, unknown function [Plasmodium gallinaceum]|uniref:Uncharacterized protein n=1 Tax=Plasmodium gallinaceum TaxID=5849 RepID=A0A1J1GRE5_PLAGA|nr:conserved Plasmodium protein, unknown function [Plasmodium gallinaceum]CRG93856.1 conserved Plasmodium protein, unknown function [Plasmodium gallinaceum]